MRNKLLIQTLVILMIVLIPSLVFATPDNPGGDPDVPIDGGLSLLLAAGIAYGAKKGYDVQKRKKAEAKDEILEK